MLSKFWNKITGKTDGKRKWLPALIAAAVFAAVAAGVIAANALNPIRYTLNDVSNISYEKGVVTAVEEEHKEPAPDFPGLSVGVQIVTVRMKNGPQKGEELTIENDLSLIQNVDVKKGTGVIVRAERPGGVTPHYALYSYDRTPGIIVVACIFIAVMLLVGGRKGLRSVLGLAVSVFFVFVLLLPAVFRGQPPVLMAVLTALLTASFSLLLLNGFSRKTAAALGATACSVLIAGVFYAVISRILKLTGYGIDEAEELIMVSRATGLQIGQVLFAGVLIASLGAVMDMTVSVSAAMFELTGRQPELTPPALFRSGMSVGRDMVGATCQTLILAFIGSAFASVLTIMAYGASFDRIFSSNYVALEILQGASAALAVVAAAPLTAALCAFIQRAKRPAEKENKDRTQTAKQTEKISETSKNT
ncbi:hypothetical protein FACS1894211_11070 [Clostridia bacterium]|nr:hypothetical protein FACS1894211_11070 [Clostridia bacterium]